MFNIDQLRSRQEERLVPALESWNDAKVQLEKAMALAEQKEREFRDVSDDVQRKLAALDMVIAMANELGDERPAEWRVNAAENKPTLMLLEKTPEETKGAGGAETAAPIPVAISPGFRGLLRRSSRPLFPPDHRPNPALLSIRQ